jgi:hypothetical protein
MQALLTQDPNQCAPLLARTIPQQVNATVAGRYRKTIAYVLHIFYTVHV